MQSIRLTVIIEQDTDGFTATVPQLPGCFSCGDTEQEAFENIQEAIALYLEPLPDEYAQANNQNVIRRELKLNVA